MKKNLFGITAIVIAIAFSAFTTKSEGSVKSGKFTSPYWFRYTSASTAAGDQRNSANYVYDGTTPSCSATTSKECYVQLNLASAPLLNSNPDFSNGQVNTNTTTGIPFSGTTFNANRVKL